jgi:hypothetical protein
MTPSSSLVSSGRDIDHRLATGVLPGSGGKRPDMTKPQQPELRRSGRGATDDDSAKAKASSDLPGGGAGVAPVPPDNMPGHHPEHEQDKPPLGEQGSGGGTASD